MDQWHEPKGTPVDPRCCAMIAEGRGETEVADRLRAAACVVSEALKREQEAKQALACMVADRDKWRAAARGRSVADRLAEVMAEHEGGPA